MQVIADVQPKDRHNTTLIDNVHPADWVNPEPSGRYNLVVVGGGTAGLVSAAGAALLGARVALVERHLLGGDCLVTGCVPSKALIRSSRAAAEVAGAARFGIRAAGAAEADFAAVMERLREARAEISHHDALRRFRDFGVDIFLGDGRFGGPDVVEVGETSLRFKKAVIATGGRPVTPAVPGLHEAGFLTNETVFNLTELPRRLMVVGGGPVGTELAQAFARLGSRVTLVELLPRFLPNEDTDAAELLSRRLVADGVRLRLGTALKRVEVTPDGKRALLERDGAEESVTVDALLVGVGRAPNVDRLGLDLAGVEHGREGVRVDDRLRTSNPRIFAAGDVALSHKFTHTADAAARIILQNALFPGPRKKLSGLVVPWCTYTSPEIAHVGLYEEEAHGRGIPVETIRVEMSDVDRAIVDGETEGFLKIHLRRGTDSILGATIVDEHAGEMISEITLAMTAGVGLGAISNVIHPYPTRAEAIKKAADDYNRRRLTPRLRRVLERWFAWTR
jgi:pyruvate/2-oxoglutarate dehydrogenase complex dihydrolipoamide dehydrogenase (E3) component